MFSENDPASTVLSAQGVGKCYHIYGRPQDRLRQVFLRRWRTYYREFWAVRHATFELRRGEALGIIGRNGSGKSTLLQIIAGTLRPSEGEVRLTGRVAALLELGSGFNPQFTGRENVFLYGTILGVPQAEIQRKFDDIVRFAEIGEFLDQPVKTYSSGMFVRLAFAVAAHVDADLLIVDEALAVGDEGFQRKCFSWLENFKSAGGSLLFVTHATQAVVKLCERAILLDQGRILAHGAAKPVTDVYQKLLHGSAAQGDELRRRLDALGGAVDGLDDSDESAELPGDAVEEEGAFQSDLVRPPETTYGIGGAEILDVQTFDDRGRRANVLSAGRRCELRYRVRFDRASDGVRCGMMIKTIEGIDVVGVSSVHLGWRLPRVEAGRTATLRFKLALNVAPGIYFLNAGVSALVDGQEQYLHRRVDVAAIRVIAPDDRDIYGLAYTDPQIDVHIAEPSATIHG